MNRIFVGYGKDIVKQIFIAFNFVQLDILRLLLTRSVAEINNMGSVINLKTNAVHGTVVYNVIILMTDMTTVQGF